MCVVTEERFPVSANDSPSYNLTQLVGGRRIAYGSQTIVYMFTIFITPYHAS